MAMSCCISFVLKVAFPVPLPMWNICRTSWNWIEDDIQWLMMPDVAFHRTSTRPIPLKLVPPTLVIITTVYQAHDAASSPPLKAACMITTNLSQLPGLGSSSCIAAWSHILKCLALMIDGPPSWCSRSRSTALEISSSIVILSYTRKEATSIGIGCPSGRTW